MQLRQQMQRAARPRKHFRLRMLRKPALPKHRHGRTERER
jgi:hypothetical protein